MDLALWAVAMAIAGVFVWRRGWRELPRWQRGYIWCALVVVPLVSLPAITGYFPAGILLRPFFALMAAYTLIISTGQLVGVLVLVQSVLPETSRFARYLNTCLLLAGIAFIAITSYGSLTVIIGAIVKPPS